MKVRSELEEFIKPIRRRLWFVVALILVQGCCWFVVHSVLKGQQDAVVRPR